MAEVKQTKNDAFITGILKEKKLENKIKDGKEMIEGTLVVLTEDDFGTGEITVRVNQRALTNKGTENSLYKGLVTVQQTYKSVEEVGIEQADYIKIKGDLSDNVFYAVDKGTFVETTTIRGTFINRVKKEENPSGCKVCIEGYVSEIKPVDNGEVEVTIVGVGYNGIAQKFTGLVQKELGQAFMSIYQLGATTSLNFAIVNSVETQEIQTSVGFGSALGEQITKTTTKKIIFGGEQPRYDGLSKDDVKKAMALRESKKEENKQKALEKANGTSNMANGFNTGAVQEGFVNPGMTQGGFSIGANQGGFVPGGFNIQ